MGWWFKGRDQRPGAGRVTALLIALTISGLACRAQSSHPRTTSFDPSAQAAARRAASGRVRVPAGVVVREIREIKDPSTGARWLILSNREHASGPGRMVLVPEGNQSGTGGRAERGENIAPVPAIHQGDRVVVEEHTPVADGSLDAVALGPAAAGSVFHVRLTMGGEVLRAVAIAPGRAAFLPAPGMAPAGVTR